MDAEKVYVNPNDYVDVTDECRPFYIPTGYVKLSHKGVGLISWGIGKHYVHVEGKEKGYLIVATKRVLDNYMNFRVWKKKPEVNSGRYKIVYVIG